MRERRKIVDPGNRLRRLDQPGKHEIGRQARRPAQRDSAEPAHSGGMQHAKTNAIAQKGCPRFTVERESNRPVDSDPSISARQTK